MNHLTMITLKTLNELNALREGADKGQKLPRFCYGRLLASNQLIVIERGDMGYIALPYKDGTVIATEALVEDMNAQIGVSRLQAACMRDGSCFGWDVPGADPANFDDAGRYIPKDEDSDV